MRNRTTDVRFPIFAGQKVRVIFSHNIARTGARLRQDLRGCDAAFVWDADKPGVSWIVFGPNPDEATVCHEASHAVRAILRHIGARNDDETFAYHLDYLVGRIHKFLKRR